METDRTLALQEAVNIAAWSHNTNVNRLGYTPMQLQLGKSISLPGFTEGTIVTDSKFDSEIVEKLITNMKTAIKNFNIANFKEKITEATATRIPKYCRYVYDKGEEVYIQKEDKKLWSGPVKVVTHDGNCVWVIYNGNLLKVAECRVQPVNKKTNSAITEEKIKDQVKFEKTKKVEVSIQEEKIDHEGKKRRCANKIYEKKPT